VVEDRARMSGASVIADEEAGVVAAVDALAHEPRLRGADEQLGARVDLIGIEVVHVAVGVVDAEPRRAVRCGTFDGGVHFLGHPGARALVLDAAHHHVAVGRDAADAFHVDGDPHARGIALRHGEGW